MKNDDSPLVPIIAWLETLGDRVFTTATALPPGLDGDARRICAHLRDYGLIIAAGRGRWRVNAEKLDETRGYLHLQAVAGEPLTDDVFERMVSEGQLLDTGLRENGQPLYALNLDQSGRRN